MSTKQEELKLAKATIYTFGTVGVTAQEVTGLRVHVAPWRQHARALHAAYCLPRDRTPRGFVQAGKLGLVVLSGWGHNVPSTLGAHLRSAEFSKALRDRAASVPGLTVHDYRD